MRFARILIIVFAILFPLAAAWAAEEFVWAPRFPVGSQIPMLEAEDHTGTTQTLATLAGEKGLVLLFNRSFDWCPYCKAQLKDLVKQAPAIEALGFNVATLTYDPVATLNGIAGDEGIRFKLLHDEAVTHVNAFGVLNTDYEPGHRAYGIPQPGILVISPDGIILLKFSEENYRMRPDFAVVIEGLQAL